MRLNCSLGRDLREGKADDYLAASGDIACYSMKMKRKFILPRGFVIYAQDYLIGSRGGFLRRVNPASYE